MKLNTKQREKLKEWVASGLVSADINYLAAEFDPPFSIDRRQVDGYKRRLAPKVKAVLAEMKVSPLKAGLALKENRIAALQRLADKLQTDLYDEDLFWTVDRIQEVGSGENRKIMEIEGFNGAEIRELRGTLDDIAKEVGDRVVKQEFTGADGKPVIDLNPIAEMLAKIYGYFNPTIPNDPA